MSRTSHRDKIRFPNKSGTDRNWDSVPSKTYHESKRDYLVSGKRQLVSVDSRELCAAIFMIRSCRQQCFEDFSVSELENLTRTGRDTPGAANALKRAIVMRLCLNHNYCMTFNNLHRYGSGRTLRTRTLTRICTSNFFCSAYVAVTRLHIVGKTIDRIPLFEMLRTHEVLSKERLPSLRRSKSLTPNKHLNGTLMRNRSSPNFS